LGIKRYNLRLLRNTIEVIYETHDQVLPRGEKMIFLIKRSNIKIIFLKIINIKFCVIRLKFVQVKDVLQMLELFRLKSFSSYLTVKR